ncbi:unnamed protein product [Parnassius mnemosyne]|uniref:Uncharacterized protein n=1 Tax=Parnassius mnemosyne TaxID=213953 RepID=A0AAV1MAJ1_9NEOP
MTALNASLLVSGQWSIFTSYGTIFMDVIKGRASSSAIHSNPKVLPGPSCLRPTSLGLRASSSYGLSSSKAAWLEFHPANVKPAFWCTSVTCFAVSKASSTVA